MRDNANVKALMFTPNAPEAATQSVSDHRVTCAQVARIPN
jgi:hypothetical protein